MSWRIGIDLGGTKTEGILLDPDGREAARHRVDSPKGDCAATVECIAGIVRHLDGQAGTQCLVGLGTPGAISPRSGLLKGSNSTWLNGQPLDRMVADAIGRPVRIQNDANCMAVSEAIDGAAAGAHVVVGLIIGTGCGSGIAIDGRPLTGLNAIAGECGHNPLPWPMADELPGPDCYCGKQGCVETWVSGTGFCNDYARRTGERITGADIVARAGQGEQAALDSLAAYESRLARTLAHIINMLDPDVIVLGGGMSNVDRLYENLPAMLDEWCFSDGVSTPVRPPLHGDSTGVRGAAWLWPPETPD